MDETVGGAQSSEAFPAVSIGMPVYNSRSDFFERAVSSLLAQDYRDIEVIISDNGSSPDATSLYRAAARRDARIRYIRHQSNRGAVWNFNYVLSQSHRDFFMWAADDDQFDPTFVRKAVTALRDKPAAVSAYAEVALVDQRGQHYGVRLRTTAFASPSTSRRLSALQQISFTTYGLHRRTALLRAGPMPETYGGDFVFMTTMALMGPFAYVPEVLFFYQTYDRKDPVDLVEVMLNPDAPPSQRVASYKSIATSILDAVWRSPARYTERVTRYAVTLGALAKMGWFTADSLNEASSRMRSAVASRRYVDFLRYGAIYLCLHPSGLARRENWQKLFARK